MISKKEPWRGWANRKDLMYNTKTGGICARTRTRINSPNYFFVDNDFPSDGFHKRVFPIVRAEILKRMRRAKARRK